MKLSVRCRRCGCVYGSHIRREGREDCPRWGTTFSLVPLRRPYRARGRFSGEMVGRALRETRQAVLAMLGRRP